MTSQRAFREALLNPAAPVPDGLCDGKGQSAGRRYAVYRNNVTVSLKEAMVTAFPLVRKIIGRQLFDQLATEFVRAHPPRTPLMMAYGAELPRFVENAPAFKHIGYLGDAARLDLAMRASYHAADADPLTAAALSEMEPEDLLQSHFKLALATRILRSPWPLFDIWQYNMVPDAPKPQPVQQDVLITRIDFDPAPLALPAGGADWLAALDAGTPFGAANDLISTRVPEFDLAACLTLALTAQALISPSSKEPK